MNRSDHAVCIALLCLSCASAPAPQRPSEPEPHPACFTGTGAIGIPSPAAPAVRAVGQETFGIGGLPVDGGTSPAKEGTIGLGTIGRSGIPLTVIPGQPNFHGAVERENLRRTVRGRLHELATCREASTAPAHQLIGGRIVLDFVIGPHGRVERSSVRSSTLDDPKIDDCVGRQACRWRFAAPRDGGKAVVSYPLVLTQEIVP